MKYGIEILVAALMLAASAGAGAQSAKASKPEAILVLPGQGWDQSPNRSEPEVVKQVCEEPQPDAPLLQIDLRSRLPNKLEPGYTRISEGGGFTNGGFPALSADGSQIAILRDPTEVMEDAYPVFELYSTASLRLQKRIDLNSEREKNRARLEQRALDLKSPESLEDLHQGLDEIRRILDHGAFRALPRWYDYLWYYNKLPQYAGKISNSSDCRGYRLIETRDPDTGDNLIQIISLATGKVTFNERLPVIEVYKDPENPHNDCWVRGSVWEGWHVPEAQIAVMKVIFSANYCGLPERWIVTRY